MQVGAEPGYTLSPEDILEISVWREESLTKQVVIRPDGAFSSLSLIGNPTEDRQILGQTNALRFLALICRRAAWLAVGVGTFPEWLAPRVAPASSGLFPQPVSMSRRRQ